MPVIAVDTVTESGWSLSCRMARNVQRIVEKGIGEMRRNFGSEPERYYGRHRPWHRRLLL